MKEQSNYDYKLVTFNGILLRFLMGAITFCLILGTINVTIVIFRGLFTPPIWDIDVSLILSNTFQSILYILIGYELFKALHIVVTSRAIPDLPIIRIAIIALANKIIALNVMVDDFRIMLGLAAILISLSIASFCLKLKDIVHTFHNGRQNSLHTSNHEESPFTPPDNIKV